MSNKPMSNKPQKMIIATTALLVLAILFATGDATAKINPLKIMTYGVKNAMHQIMIVFDASGSIDSKNGAGCSGINPGTFDYTGDGMCSGYENNVDCISKSSNAPGFYQNCKPPTNGTIGGRLFMLKRIMRNVLPEFSQVATFGLITYPDHQAAGSSDPAEYFLYNPQTGTATKGVTVFFHERELKSGGWIGDAGTTGWHWGSKTPLSSFIANGVRYYRLDQAIANTTDFPDITNGPNSLYRRAEGDGYLDKRFDYNGQQFSDGTYSWTYVGSYYSFLQVEPRTNVTRNFTQYRGPQYVQGGTTYVYHRFGPNNSQMSEIGDKARLVQPFLTGDDPVLEQSNLYDQFTTLLNRLNDPWQGGIATDSSGQKAPARQALQLAQRHFQDSLEGTGPFSAAGPDSLEECRIRAIIIITDGKFNPKSDAQDPVQGAKDVYLNYPSSEDNRINTYVVGMFPQNNEEDTIDGIADYGDDGKLNGSVGGLSGQTEEEITFAFRETLVAALKGDFTTSAPGVTTILTEGGAQILDNISLIPSTQYPCAEQIYCGKLRAIDLSQNPPALLWEAGQQLSLRNWGTRKLFSGYHDSHANKPGFPVPLIAFDATGAVNIDGSGAKAEFLSAGVGIRDLWPSWSTAPSDAELRGFVRWLAGDRLQWKLGPIIRSVPASVGPPPEYAGFPDHDTFENDYDDRERMTYLTAADGAMHAFRTQSGSELYAYYPPDLFPLMYEIFKQGGQDPDPQNFIHTFTSSVRVEDVYDKDTKLWKTVLILPIGAAGEKWIAMDVTTPTPGASLPVDWADDPPLRLLEHSDDLDSNPASKVTGETWSLPSLYFDWVSGAPYTRMSWGGGYTGSFPNDGEWYCYLPDMVDWDGSTLEVHERAAIDPQVDYGVLASTSSVLDYGSKRQVIASYQADLEGRIYRYVKGNPDPVASATLLVDAGKYHPFYYAPSAYYTGGGITALATASGSFYEENPFISDPSYSPSFSSRVFVFEDHGTGSPVYPLAYAAGGDPLDTISCPIEHLCDCLDTTTVPCDASVVNADWLPNGEPLLVRNALKGDATEVFLLFYDPPPQTLSSCSERVGDSYVVRLRHNGAGKFSLADSIKAFSGQYASGLSIVGRGEDVAIAVTGIGSGQGDGAEATIALFTGSTSLKGQNLLGELIVEGVREVR